MRPFREMSMNADDFVKRLGECIPPQEKLNALGLPKSRIREKINSRRATPRAGIPATRNQNPILELIQNYDLSTVDIGMVTFLNRVIRKEGKLIIGEFEQDPLMLNESTGEVYISDHIKPSHIMCKCALDGAHFLDALIIAARHLSECGVNYPLAWDQTLKHSVAQECASKAGGKEYLKFCEVLIGCE